MLTREQKTGIVAELRDRFARQRILIFTDIRSISVAKLTALRRELKKLGAELKVTKKTLLQRALEAVRIGIQPKELDGEVAVIFGYEDQVSPAKAATKFTKENKTFKILAGVLAGRILQAGEVVALAKLPPREEILSQLARTLSAPIQNLAIVLQGSIRNLVVVLSKINKNLESRK